MPVGSALIEEFKGVNLSKHPLRLEDDELVLALNTYPVERGMPDLRPNGRLIGVAGDSAEGGYAAADGSRLNNCGLVQFFDSRGAHHLLVWQYRADAVINGRLTMRELLDFNMDGSQTIDQTLRYRSVYLQPLATGGDEAAAGRAYYDVAITAFQCPGFAVRNGKLYIFIGTGNPLVLEAGVQDSIIGTSGGMGAQSSYWGCVELQWNVAPVGLAKQLINGSTATVQANQVVLAGVRNYPNKLFCADPSDVGDFTAVAPITSSIDVGTTDDPIVAVVTVPILGGSTAIEPYLLVLKRNSTWMVQGPLPDSTSRGDIRVVPLMRTEGCVNKLTVVETPSGIIWCSGKNVFIMEPGQNPRAIGDNIASYLKTREASADNPAWHAAWDTTLGCYRLSIPRGLASSALNEFESATSGPVTFPAEQWWCDMREPDEPAWWGPMTMSGLTHMLEHREPNGPMLGTWMPLDTNSQGPRPISSGPHLCAIGDRTTGNLDWSDYYNTAQSSHPYQEVKTKVFAMGDPFIEKLLEAVELFFSISPKLSTEHSVSATALLNMKPAPRIVNRTGTDVVPEGDLTLVLGVGTLDTAGFGEGFHTLALTPQNASTGQRLPSNVLQVSIVCKNTLNGLIRPRMRLASAGIRIRPLGRRSTGHDGH